MQFVDNDNYNLLLNTLCTCVQLNKWHSKWSQSSSGWFQVSCETSKLWKVMGSCTAQCRMLLFCLRTIVRESHNFGLVFPKKEENSFWPFSGFLIQYFVMLLESFWPWKHPKVNDTLSYWLVREHIQYLFRYEEKTAVHVLISKTLLLEMWQ